MQGSQAIKSSRITLVSKEKYKVDLEYNKEFAILHLPIVSKFTRDVYLDMTMVMEDIEEFLMTVGYPNIWVAVDPANTTIAKLAKKFKFEYRGSADGMDVYMKEKEV